MKCKKISTSPITVHQTYRRYAGKILRALHLSKLCYRIRLSHKSRWIKNLDPENYERELCKWYRKTHHAILDLEHPRTFNEKCQWLKIYDNTPIKSQLHDKYMAKKWVCEKIGEEYVIPLIGVWDKFEDIDFDTLPNQFVLKATHGSGWQYIVTDKSKFNLKQAKKDFDFWLSVNLAYSFSLYALVEHPRIIAEEYISNIDGNLNDYKVHCFNGVPKYIKYIGGRSTNNTHEIIYDTEWNPLEVTNLYPVFEHPETIPRPKQLSTLLDLCHRLSEGFIYLRVDFYVLDDGNLKFGEITPIPADGTYDWNPPEYNQIFGDLITLPIDERR